MQTQTKSLADLHLGEEMEYELIKTICEWERIEYGEGKHRTPKTFYECVQKNRSGFFVSMSSGTLVGYADVWQLESDFYQRLKVGTIDEESLSHSHILSASDRRTNLWYIGSIVTAPQYRRDSPSGAAFLFAYICNVLPGFFESFSVFPASVLGVGSSSFGKKLLKRWNFSPVLPDERAIDLRPRYEKRLNDVAESACFFLGHRRS